EPIKDWSLTSLKEKLIKTGAKVVSHGRYVAFQMAEVAAANVPGDFAADRGTTAAATTSASVRRSMSCIQEQPTEGVRPNARGNGQIRPSTKLGLPEVLVAVGTSRLSCKRAGKTRTLMPVWDSSGESRFKSLVEDMYDDREQRLIAESAVEVL